MKKSKVKQFLLDLLYIMAGSTVYALGVSVFTAPNHIAPGGVTGIATMLNYLFDTPIGIMVIVLNIPIVLWAILEIGYKLVMKSMMAIAISSVLIDVVGMFIPPYSGDSLLTAIFGGVLEGIGLGIVFMRGATTGGTDLVARLLGRRLRHISMGKLMLAIDIGVVTISGFVFQSIESAMYAGVVIFVCTSLIDAILYGTDIGAGKTFYILSPKTKEIGDRIMKEMDRGVTYLQSRGGYNKQEGEMLFCAVRRYEVYKINEIIRSIDRDAFVIVGEAGEISGEGFKPTSSDDKSLKELIQNRVKKKEAKN
ncbi:YitT family protein [Scatolibacter rhodanostii]|uniref:YitT family protein n=1 Tax=Scatolibacter rhodanostii TaxID=2014781 RepID=UPI000C082952|nr:YitT family protein [Scatolibacter rhodanostii]